MAKGKEVDYIDLDLDYNYFPAPSPAYTQQPLVKAEPVRANVFDAMPALNLEGPAKKKTPEKVGERKEPEREKAKTVYQFPPKPRVIYRYCKENEMAVGPTRTVVLPPTNGPTSKKQRPNDLWTAYLLSASSSVFNPTRRAAAPPPLEDLLSNLREQASKKNSKPNRTVTPPSTTPVPTSLTAACLSLHTWMHALIDASFTPQQAASDFLLLSLLHEEVSLGVYTTPPQIILQLKRRVAVFTSSRDTQEANAVIKRMDSLWRRWSAHGMQRPCNECHQFIEGTASKMETKHMTNIGPEKVLNTRYLCAAGTVLDLHNMVQTEDDGPMTLKQAVAKQYESAEAYPGFLVMAPLDRLVADKEYRIRFFTLAGSIDITHSTSASVFIRNWAAPFIDLPDRFSTPNIKKSEAPPEPRKQPQQPQKQPAPAPSPVNERSRRQAAQNAEDALAVTPKKKRSETPTNAARPAKRQKKELARFTPCDVIRTDGKRQYYRMLRRDITEEVALEMGQDVLHLDTRMTNPGSALQKKKIGRVVAIYDDGAGAVVEVKLYRVTDSGKWEVVETDAVEELAADKLSLAHVEVRSTADVALEPCGSVKNIAGEEVWKLKKWDGPEWVGGEKRDTEFNKMELRLLCWQKKSGKNTVSITGAVDPDERESLEETPPPVEPTARPPRRVINFRSPTPQGVKTEPKLEPKLTNTPVNIAAIIAKSNQPTSSPSPAPTSSASPVPVVPAPSDPKPAPKKTRTLSFRR